MHARGSEGGKVERVIWFVALVIGRLVGEPDAPLPTLGDRSVLFIKRQQVVDDCATGPLDAGVPDAGPTDGGASDAGMMGDAGLDDAGTPDADAGSCTGEVVDAITMVVQPDVVEAVPGARFAMLYVTPSRPIVELTQPVFGRLETLTAPRVEYEEVEVEDPSLGTQCPGCGGDSNYEGGGCGGGTSYDFDPPGFGGYDDLLVDAGAPSDGGPGTEMIGPYQIVRAQPIDTMQLAGWLDNLGYEYQQQDLDAVAPYLLYGYHVVAVRIVDDLPFPTKLRPLAITWAGTEIRIPAALAAGTGMATASLTVYIAANDRMELPGATVDFAGRTAYDNMGFLTRNDVVLDLNQPALHDPVALPSQLGEHHKVSIIKTEKRVPVAHCEPIGCGCGDCSTGRRTRYDLGLVLFAVLFTLRRRRK